MARKRKGEGDAAESREPEVTVLPQGDVIFPDPDAHDWVLYGSSGGVHFDVCRVTGERRARSGDSGLNQRAWLDGGEWDTSVDMHADDERLHKEQRAADREAENAEKSAD